MDIKEYKKIEELQKKCKCCIWLVNCGGVYYCPFSGCLFDKK